MIQCKFIIDVLRTALLRSYS